MNKTTIAHFINPFLPITQNWMYHQLCFNTEFRHIVLCQTRENADLFPWETVFPAFTQNSLFARASMLLSRVRAQYFQGFYHKILTQEKPRIVHGHFSWESWRNFGLIKKLGLPLVTTFYGLDVNKLASLPQWKRRYSLLFQRGDIFTVEGPCMAESLKAIGCPEQKIRIIPLGVDIDTISKALQPKTGTAIKIMFVGLEREKKGGLFAAQAFATVAKENKNLEFHLIGSGRYQEPIKKILEQAGVLRQCIFHGYIALDKYYNLLGRMDIVMAPSVIAQNGDTEGGAPVVVIEAQAAGIPVVGTLHCDIPNIVKNNETGFLCAERDVDALTNNLNSLIFNAKLRTTMGLAAGLHARKNLTIQNQVAKLALVYKSLL